MRRLRFALSQGLLLEPSLEALRAIGVAGPARGRDDRRLIVPAGEIDYVFARPSDIATYVERGAADLGVVGEDVLLESSARVMDLVDLRFGACRFVVAAPASDLTRSLDEYRHLGSLEVATKYPRVAARHFERRGIAVEIVRVSGSVEVAPRVGLADWIVDLVATGATLRANELAIVEEITGCTARLVANPVSFHARRPELEPIVGRLGAWAVPA